MSLPAFRRLGGGGAPPGEQAGLGQSPLGVHHGEMGADGPGTVRRAGQDLVVADQQRLHVPGDLHPLQRLARSGRPAGRSPGFSVRRKARRTRTSLLVLSPSVTVIR